MNKIISWDEYFMGVALIASKRSKDPNTQVGACIIDSDKKIVSVGYNGLPTGVDDKLYPWDVQSGQLHQTKYAYVVHAELNAILNSKGDLKNSTMYTTLFPCNECVKAIAQAGIKKIIYLEDKYTDQPSQIASRKMLDDIGIKYTKISKFSLIIQ